MDSPATRRRPSVTPEQWHARTEAPLTATAVLFLVVYSWSVLADLQGDLEEAAEWVMWSLWFVFVVDYVVRLLLAEHRLHWFATHLLQFLMVALPVLRPLRLLRLLMLFDVLRRATGELMRGRVTVYVAGSAAMLVYIASLAELESERHAPGAHIVAFHDALWWAFETITTVGYGDRVPVTVEGRAVAIGLMIAGIAMLGVITATIASWMVERVQLADRESDAVTVAHIDALTERLERLSAQVAALQAAAPAPEDRVS
jgi:voltage-gated potassium channel